MPVRSDEGPAVQVLFVYEKYEKTRYRNINGLNRIIVQNLTNCNKINKHTLQRCTMNILTKNNNTFIINK